MKSKFIQGKKLNITNKNTVKYKVDQFLQDQYNHLKGKNVLKQSSTSGFFSCGSKVNNDMIMDYIKNIYDQYQINDPLKDNIKSQTSIRRQIIQTPNKNAFYQQIHVPNTHRRGNSLITEANTMSNRIHTAQNSHAPSFSSQVICNNQRRSASIIINPPQKKIINQNIQKMEQFNNQQQKTIKKKLEYGLQQIEKKNNVIQQRYRYCIGCEEAVLTGNMQYHENKCEQFQKIYKMQFQQILIYLQKKIEKIRQKAKKFSMAIKQQDSKKIRMLTQNIYEESKQISKSGRMSKKFMYNYDNAINIGKKWSQISQQINKLRWFLKIRQQIKKKFDY